MDRPPRGVSERVIDRRMQVGIGVIGATMAVATLAMLDLRLPGGLIDGTGDASSARTSAFTVLVLAQLFNTVNARSDTDSAIGRLTINPWLLGAVALSAGLQVVVVHVPVFQQAFGTTALSLGQWAMAALFASSVVVVGEIRKGIVRSIDRRG
jgi:magnesium-transporting ATPase (P-type)